MRALCLPLLALLSADSGDRPSSAVLRRTYEGSRSSIVQVIGPKGSGTGIIVGAGGEVLTSVDYVGLNEAKVRWEGRELPARVTLANASLKVAMIEISAPGSLSGGAWRLPGSLATGAAGWRV